MVTRRIALFVLVAGAALGAGGCGDEPQDAPGGGDEAPVRPLAAAQPGEREQALRDLHDKCVTAFADQPGFGMRRMGPLHSPGEYPKEIDLPAGYPLLADAAVTPAGSEPVAPAREAWSVARVELVGLTRHPEPVVYPHDDLLARLGGKAKTRAPDEFETAALAALAEGGTLEVREQPGEIRMVGAIRTGAKCAACHKDAASDTLGAFSYVLRPAAK